MSAVPLQVVNQGPQSGPLTALYAGDLIQTPRGLAPLSLEGFSEDLDEDGYVDPIADAEPVVAAAPAVQYAAAPAVQYAAAPAVQYAAAPVQYASAPAVQYAAAPAVQYAAAPVQYAAAPAVQYAAAPVQYATAPAVQYAAAPAAAVQYAYNYPSVYGTGAAVPQTWATGKLKLILKKIISKSYFFPFTVPVAHSGAAVGGCVNYQGSVVPCAAE